MSDASSFIHAGETKVVIDPVGIAEFLRSENGPVLRKMVEVGEAVKTRTIESLKEGFPRDFLGPAVVKRIVMGEHGPSVLVGSDRVTTQPHEITGSPVLVFDWPKGGGTVFFTHVNHPGSDFGKYLGDKLLAALTEVRSIV